MLFNAQLSAFRAMGRNVGLIITTLVADTVAHGPDGLPHPIVIASVARRATGVAHAIELLNQIGFERYVFDERGRF